MGLLQLLIAMETLCRIDLYDLQSTGGSYRKKRAKLRDIQSFRIDKI